MGKLNVNNVGAIWTALLMLVGLIAAAILEFKLFLILVAVILAYSFIIGVPYLITYLWNRFVAK
jgi:hypothetical protein